MKEKHLPLLTLGLVCAAIPLALIAFVWLRDGNLDVIWELLNKIVGAGIAEAIR